MFNSKKNWLFFPIPNFIFNIQEKKFEKKSKQDEYIDAGR